MKTPLLLVLLLSLASTGCGAEKKKPGARMKAAREVADGVQLLGHIEHPAIRESSGVISCRADTNVFWTHNDGRRPILYGITRSGKSVAEFPIIGATIHDWEDIANDDDGHLYVGDIGNNDAKRSELAVHQIDEPDPKSSARALRVKRSWRLRFPKAPFDCESLFIWQDHGYVISKVFNDAPAEIYRFPLAEAKQPVVLEFVARLPITSPVTGADITRDGRLLGIVSKTGAYVFKIKGEVSRASAVKFEHTRFKHEHIEGCCFVPEGLLATAESREIFLFTDEHFRERK